MRQSRKKMNHNCFITPPDITEEERERRIAEFQRVIWKLWDNLPYETQLEIIQEQAKKREAV